MTDPQPNNLPDIGTFNSGERLLAQALFPTLYTDRKAALALEEPLSLILRAVALVKAGLELEGVGAAPYVRELEYRANRDQPNVVPSVSDLVGFDLREVFNPQLRPILLEVPPTQDFKDAMAMNGFDAYWADTFWAAHWHIPGPQQAAEMLARLRPGRVRPDLVFGEDDYRRLLRWNDILPKFHDQLRAIAYNPITRVDIRRLYHTGVISYDEMVERYQDLNYSPADAKLLADFTKKDYDPEDRAATKSDVLEAYYAGVFNRDTAKDSLMQIGYRDELAETFLRVQDARLAAREAAAGAARNKKVASIMANAKKALVKQKYDERLVLVDLEALGLTHEESVLALKTNGLPAE